MNDEISYSLYFEDVRILSEKRDEAVRWLADKVEGDVDVKNLFGPIRDAQVYVDLEPVYKELDYDGRGIETFLDKFSLPGSKFQFFTDDGYGGLCFASYTMTNEGCLWLGTTEEEVFGRLAGNSAKAALYCPGPDGDKRSFIPFDALDAEQLVLASSSDAACRRLAAEKGWGLDMLMLDKSPLVRRAVAAKGYGLATFAYDEDSSIRAIAARYGHNLDNAARDPEECVRREVASQGYALDLLAEDPSHLVRKEASRYLERRNLTLEQWVAENPDRCALPENRCRVNFDIKAAKEAHARLQKSTRKSEGITQ